VYRDDPLDDEAALRDLVGDPAVDALVAAGTDALAAAVDALRLLQGWVADGEAGAWLTGSLRRLAGRTPLEALAAGRLDEVEEALRDRLAALG